MDKHLFILPPGLYRGANAEEIAATASGLVEMDLFNLPYERDVYVQLAWSDCVSQGGKQVSFSPHIFAIVGPLGKDQTADAVLVNTSTGVRVSLLNDESAFPHDINPDTKADAAAVVELVHALLIVLLATRNVVKTTKQNKLAKLGIGKSWRSQFAYTTTITLPADLEDDPDRPPIGTAKAPHLRRGHVRRQHFGPGYQYEKKIWVAPVFVNADADFVNRRVAYNVVKV